MDRSPEGCRAWSAASDVSNAIRSQNVQAAAGRTGASPSQPGVNLQLNVNAQGRLRTPEEFGNIIVKSGANGEITRLRDVARIELGAADYSLRSLLDGRPAVAVAVLQAPGSNAIEIADNVKATMDQRQLAMPQGVKYEIVYDTTKFVRASIEKVVDTLLEAIALVVLVFLQTWRASIIPLIAVPVSIIGTSAVMYAFGFSINALTLFGLVLAIAISTVISAINSLTLSAALAALLLKDHHAKKDWLTRFMDAMFGWFFRGFNRAFGAASNGYGRTVGGLLSRKSLVMILYLALVGVTYSMFSAVPNGFVPAQDKQYLIGFAQLPDGATLDRTEAVIKRMSDIALERPGVAHAIAFPGLSINGFTIGSNAGIAFAVLDDFEERKTPELSGGAIAMALNQKFVGIQDAYIAMFPPPPVNGLGTTGGFKLQIEDRAGLENQALNEATKAVLAKAYQTPELAGIFSRFQINVPQLYADLDRGKAKQLGVSVPDVFETLQIYLGSLYVNDFNAFGRTYSIRVQADAKFRAKPEDIGQLKVRSQSGQMIPLSALLKVDAQTGPERTTRYNSFLAADINGDPAPDSLPVRQRRQSPRS